MYSDDAVIRIVEDRFVPARVHVKEEADEYRRLGKLYGVQWTPTILLVAPDGTERHRIEGFLPKDEFIPQLNLGLAKIAFSSQRFEDAARLFADVAQADPASDAAPEALYWAGVARYKATGDATALREIARQIATRYTDSSWAKKASVWGNST